MNINNLLEAIPVDKDLPVVKDTYTCLLESGKRVEIYFDGSKFRNDYVTHWYRPVTRESMEGWLIPLLEKVENHAWIKGHDGEPLESNYLTELITQTLGQ